MPRPSKRAEIRDEIERRRAAGESLDVRSIQRVTGGSNSTITEELRRVEIRDAIAHLKSRSLLPTVAAIGQIVSAPPALIHDELMTQAGSRTPSPVPSPCSGAAATFSQEDMEALMRSALAGVLRDLTEHVQRSTAYSMDKIEYGYQRLMEIADNLKITARELLVAPVVDAAHRPPPVTDETGGRVAPPDVHSGFLYEAKLSKLANENAALIKQREYLIRLLNDAGMDVDLDKLSRIK